MKISEIMTREVLTVQEDAPLRDLARLLDRHRISGVPVCDRSGHMVGIISEYDLIARPGARTVGEAMTRDVISVMEDTDVDDVRFLLVDRKIKRVPVLRGQKLVGIVSRADLVRQLAFTWVCPICGEVQRTNSAPDYCPRCGAPGDFEAAHTPLIGED